MMTAKDYLDSEGFVSRNSDEVYSQVRENCSEEAEDELRNLLERWNIGHIPEAEFYSQVCRFAGEISFYDLLKSRQRGLVEWYLEKSLNGLERPEILDIGCGTGLEACFFAELGGLAVGIDPSRDVLRVAKKRADRRDLRNTHFIPGNRDYLPFREGSFDMTICINSLFSPDEFRGFQAELLYNFASSHRIEEMRRVLKDNGRAVLIGSSAGDPEHELSRYENKFLGSEFIITVKEIFTSETENRTFYYIFISAEK
ncbi:methyltransferase domain-containing protein [Candidatus Pacearchaeota archaeon]|nr:methyltransferase domain-containing protein [Candidatus Pacearchaeota archaeon]MBD3283767.1 methyltransferase domain-containing protein [Candidatus Pacearchaeota archaeon]